MTRFDTIRDLSARALGPNTLNAISASALTKLESEKEALELIRIAFRTKAPLRIFFDGVAPIDGHIREISDTGMEISSAGTFEDVRTSESEVPALISFELFNEFYAATIRARRAAAGIHFATLPTSISRVAQRRLDRTSLAPDEQFMVRINEVNGRRSVEGRVVDLSPVGLRIAIDLSEEEAFPRFVQLDRDVLLRAEVTGVKTTTKSAARVVYWRHDSIQAKLFIGVSCAIPIAQSDEPGFEDYLLEKRYRDVVRARGEADYLKVWQLMLQELKQVVEVDATRQESSIVTWKKTAWSPDPLHRIYLLKHSADPEKTSGTLSVSRFYSRTWLIHQLAVMGDQGRILSRQLYSRVLDFLRQTAEVKFTVGTWPKEVRVFQRYYLDFIQSDPNPDNHYLEPCLILEYPVQEALKELDQNSNPFGIRVRPFTYGDQKEVLQTLREKYPPIFLEALDLSEYRMLLEDVGAYYDKVALARTRKIILAHIGSKLAGFALVEYGSRNQNIFSLFDNFRVITCMDEPNAAYQVKRQLMKAAMTIYARAGIDHAISWTSDLDLEKCVSSCRRELDAYFWIANSVRMKAFMRHLDRFHGRLSARRGMRSSVEPEN